MRKKKTKIFFRLLVVLLVLLSIVGAAGCGSGDTVDNQHVGVKVSNSRFEAREPDGENKISGNLGAKTDNGGKDKYQPAGFVGFGFFFAGGTTYHRKEQATNQVAPFRYLAATMYSSLFSKVQNSGAKQLNLKWSGLYTPNLYTKETKSDLNLDPYEVCKKLANKTFDILSGKSSEVNAKQILQNVLSALKACVAGILVIFWAMQFMQQILQERFTMESCLKGLCQLAIGMLIVCNAQDIAGAFITGSNSIISKLTKPTSTSTALLYFQRFCWKTANGTVIYIGFFASGFGDAWFASPTFWVDFGSLFGVVVMLLPFIGQMICAYQIITQMISRMLELIVRIALAPLPLAFGAAQGFGPSSLSFLKGTFATAMQPVLIMIGAMSFDAILDLMTKAFSIQSTSMESLLGALMMFLAYMVLSGFIGQTRQLAQEIINR